MNRSATSRLFLALALLVNASCSGDHAMPTSADGGASQSWSWWGGSSGSTLLACPTSTTQTTTAVVGPLGGLLAIGGTSVSIPQNAVLTPTEFTLTIPASSYAEIDVKATGTDHYLFALPVTVSIDYGRCAASIPWYASLQVWNIDTSSKALLENMGGLDLRLLHTITFSTPHLSGYAIAD